ncbi:MAG: hypothetical protein B6D57_00260 [Candidatus Coatesbacteria bacterium 4484_99]|uniref:ABC transporter domain-containing protein n=1 Tax=Candidatus Coatesbacteria bacterium 4484_99 TaxID=1970774 RepID=A0A1W9S3B5_9BACT|nr:MAG: hypothetical protein B6D57_00260 [Candidatus Coatesbacteria bacterium 4484_99]RLC42018.1 MAG: phosphate ABC transporter ATP-binding protein [Candidatus Coatesbacteria bacterium]
MVFAFKDVSKNRGEKTVLRGVSFETPESGVFMIVGPSGSGKSTLLRLFNRLDEPDRGTILYRGRDIRSINPRRLRREVGIVFQTPAPLPGTVEENIGFGPKQLGNDVDVAGLLRQVGLSVDFAGVMADELSVGEAQRMMIARALALRPSVLLLDEPTSALDPASVRAIETLVHNLVRKDKILIVFVSHLTEQVRRIGGEGILIDSGRVIYRDGADKLADMLERIGG